MPLSSTQVCRAQLPPGSPKSLALKHELDNSHTATPTVYSPTIHAFDKTDQTSTSKISKPASVTGKLEVRCAAHAPFCYAELSILINELHANCRCLTGLMISCVH